MFKAIKKKCMKLERQEGGGGHDKKIVRKQKFSRVSRDKMKVPKRNNDTVFR